MTDHPIPLSGPMVRAILDGRKTQTRRVLRPQPPNSHYFQGIHAPGLTAVFSNGDPNVGHAVRLPSKRDRIVPAVEIPSLDGRYCADVNGCVWSRAKGVWRCMKGSPNSRGYQTVTPAHDGRYRTRAVHRLVCEAFYGFPPAGLRQVRHLDGDRRNNAPHNLDYGTQEQNWADRAAHGHGMGEKHHASKLTVADVAAIRSSRESQRRLAVRYGVTQSTIWAVRSGECWGENKQAPSPNLPRWTRPTILTVTEVRVQRVQEITEEDARAEGVECMVMDDDGKFYLSQEGSYRCGFAGIWEHLNAKRGFGWDANPWVVALTFTAEQRKGQTE